MGRKVSEKTVAEIAKTNEIEDEVQREAIYGANRSEMQYKFR